MTTATTSNPFRIVPIPAGAVEFSEGADVDTATPFRSFVGEMHLIERDDNEGDIEVYITGVQHSDGRVERRIAVHLLHWDTPDNRRAGATGRRSVGRQRGGG